MATDPRYKIVAVVDAIAGRRQRATKEYQCAAYRDYHALLKRQDIDLIVNASFSHQHAPISLECLRAGFHVLCEKPLAARAKEVDGLIAAARRAGKVLAVFHQSHFAPHFQQIRKVIDSGVLGRIVQVSIAYNGWARRWDWQTLTGFNAGSLLNTGPHPLHQGLVLFGDAMPKVTCFMDRTDGSYGDAENHVKVIFAGAGHPLVDIEVSSCCAYPPVTFNVYGTRGGLKATAGSVEWRYFRWEAAPRHKVTAVPVRNADGTPAYPVESLPWQTGVWPETGPAADATKTGYSPAAAATTSMTGVYYDRLYETLTRGTPMETSLELARRQIAVIEECQRQNPQIYGKRAKKKSGR
ncbi:MAG: Inositol 2-dehydrogenase/D-chiro-inositol 3-dehydrogenase [Verrucomicrobiae bacterium]|nr:Inositol 2-dehydrogenase/D-chiro-inositol 3-dehydrogenase [Verrucomicrobiae bacterium]